LALVLAVPTVARAQQPPAAPAPPAAAPDEADRLLDEGTRLFTEDADYDGALHAFQQSYEIRASWKALNGMALVYQQQGKYVDAIDAYERLLRKFGPTLTEGQASTVKKRIGELEKRVVVLKLDVRQEGATVTVDGKEIAHGPWKGSVRLLPGEHVVVASLDGFRTLDRKVELAPGGDTALTIELEPEKVKVVVKEKSVKLVRRFPTWLPVATMGAGVGLALVGGGMHVWAASDFNAFDDSVAKAAMMNPNPDGSLKPQTGDTSLKSSGEIKQGTAITLYVIGGAALATGAVMLYYNRPRAVIVDEKDAPPPAAPHAMVAPWFAPGAAGATAAFTW
jgi:hypothetical protein